MGSGVVWRVFPRESVGGVGFEMVRFVWFMWFTCLSRVSLCRPGPPVFLNRYCKLNSTVHPGTGHCPALNWPVQKHRGEPGHTGRVSHRAHRPRIPRSIRPTRHRQTHNNLTTDSCDSTQTHGVGDLTRPRPGANPPTQGRPPTTQKRVTVSWCR